MRIADITRFFPFTIADRGMMHESISADARIRVLSGDDVADTVTVLCDASADYPVMRFVLGPDEPYDARLRRLIEFFVKPRVLRNERLLGITSGGSLAVGALVSRPEEDRTE